VERERSSETSLPVHGAVMEGTSHHGLWFSFQQPLRRAARIAPRPRATLRTFTFERVVPDRESLPVYAAIAPWKREKDIQLLLLPAVPVWANFLSAFESRNSLGTRLTLVAAADSCCRAAPSRWPVQAVQAAYAKGPGLPAALLRESCRSGAPAARRQRV